MKKWIFPIIILVAIVFWAFGKNNDIIDKKGAADIAWSKVESQYQRRFDLIDNLVATVKGYANHEKETLEAVINARAKATSTSIDASNLTPEKMAQFQQAQQGLSGALGKLLVSVERYPELKANQNFLELQSQIEGTENRINVARDRFNEAAGAYNIFIAKFPTQFIASIFGHDKMGLFSAETGADKAPKVNFE